MKIIVAMVVLLAAIGFTSSVGADTFGTGANSFGIEFVPIGNPGNPDDTTGEPNPAGSVAYAYSMGKYAVSRDMITNANNEGGLGITLQDMGFVTGGPRDNMPATGVSWNEAARFVNWLNTSSGGFAAYNFTTGGVNDNITPWTAADTLDYDAANPFRSKRTNYVLPSMDEWYKAAYYNPGTGTYGTYPSSDGSLPTPVASGTADKTAVFDQLEQTGPADITQAGGLSAYGIMGMGGNMWEWEETESDLLNDSGSSLRGLRGGSWWNVDNPGDLAAWHRAWIAPSVEGLGFRVASLNTLGDANDDGVLNNLDIASFVLALISPSAYQAMFPNVDPNVRLDMNQDGTLNNLDIAGFVTALIG